MTKNDDRSVQFAIFSEIVDKIAIDAHLKTLSVFHVDQSEEFTGSVTLAADFIWPPKAINQRMIKIRMENNSIFVMDKEFDLVNPEVFENIADFIKELQSDPRMLPIHASHPGRI